MLSCRFLDFGVFLILEPIPETLQVYLQKCLLDTGTRYYSVFQTSFRKEVAQKLNKKVHKMFYIENSQFFHYLGHSEETFCRTICNFIFKKRAADLILSFQAFGSLYFYNFPMSKFSSLKYKFTGNVRNRQNFDLLQSILTILKSTNFSSRAFWIMISINVERLPTF